MMRRRAWLALLCPALAWAAAGSWGLTLKGPRVAGPDRIYTSRAFIPPPVPSGVHVHRVQWRYALPPGRQLDAWLCAGSRCQALEGRRGTSHGFGGVAADAPWRFRFRLRSGHAEPVQVESLRLLVDYRS